jgi:hypothetical protein
MWFQFEIFEKSILTFMDCKISSGQWPSKFQWLIVVSQTHWLAGGLEHFFIFHILGIIK